VTEVATTLTISSSRTHDDDPAFFLSFFLLFFCISLFAPSSSLPSIIYDQTRVTMNEPKMEKEEKKGRA